MTNGIFIFAERHEDLSELCGDNSIKVARNDNARRYGVTFVTRCACSLVLHCGYSILRPHGMYGAMDMTRRIGVFIIEEHTAVRQALELCLRSSPWIDVIRAVGTVRELEVTGSVQPPDVVLLGL